MRLNLLLISLGLLLGSAFASQEDVFWSEIESEYLANGDMINEHLDMDSIKSEAFARNAAFSCPTNLKSESRPTSVHQLRPGDIEVVGAIGDSLTAANAARSVTPVGIAQQFRGISWSIGGENPDIKKLVTLPNILKQYNPNLYGYSTGTGLAGTPQSGFNEAKPGRTSYQMPDQAKALVERMRKSDKVDFENGWKLVTLFIGGNDLCWTCHTAKFNADSYVKNIREALDYFHQNLPRTFVNLVSTLDVTGVEPLEGITCRAMQKFMCSCGLDKSWRTQIKSITANMQKGLEDLVNSGRYDTHDNFTVVLQPVFTKMTPPTDAKGAVDYSYFGPDCFHLSAKGHAAAAVELWNSMISPVGSKPDRWKMLGKRIPCPKNEFLYTNKNSFTETTSSA